MKSHMAASSTTTVSSYSGNQDGTSQALAQTVDIDDRAARAQTVRTRPHLTLASAPVWRHKLILTGKLDHRTAVELQDEIECLCEEGVTILTLDLHRLDAIDPVGARAVACGSAACKRRGHDFAVVSGSPTVHRALVEAGGESLLADDSDEAGLLLATGAANGSPGDTSTVMTKSL